jgi:hypothetical protein
MKKKNPVESLALINPSKEEIVERVRDTVGSAVAYAKKDPAKALGLTVFVGGSALFLHRLVVYPLPSFFPGVLALNGHTYSFTTGDRLWMGRMVIGEAGESGWENPSKLQDGAAVLWAVATRHMTKSTLRGSGSLTKTIRAFAQPVNPIWAAPWGCTWFSSSWRGCCGSLWGACSLRRLQRRARVRYTTWYGLPPQVRELVDGFIRGSVPNPIPGYNNFAAASAISGRARASSTLPAVTIGGNTFVRDPGSEAGSVRIA